jgi:DUF1009 family protein
MPDTAAFGIIAGAGTFPVQVAREVRRLGLRVVAIGLKDWVDPSLASEVDAYTEVSVGQLGRLIDELKRQGVRRAVMAGKVSKGAAFDPRVAFDATALAILARVKDLSLNGLLGAVADRLAKDGIVLEDSSAYLKDALCPAGPVTARGPTAVELKDIEIGMAVARRLAELDVGQTVVVRQTVVVAVEALEGTDAALARAGSLARGELVVVKMASPKQDARFDLPVLGARTLDAARAAGVTCLAVEAGKTLLLDKGALLSGADASGICLIGVQPPGASP